MSKNENNTMLTTIKTVKDYFDWLESITHEKKNYYGFQNVGFHYPKMVFYYRGQANKDWSIESSVLRNDLKEDKKYEHSILKEAELRLWKELSMCSTYLEKLIYLQHYGLRTRLLDVTSNPLIALYFACFKEENADGIVLVGNRGKLPRTYYEENIPELTAKYVFTHSGDEIEEDFEAFAKDNNVHPARFMHPIFVYAPINNPRIEHQNGAFILSPLVKVSDESKPERNTDSLDNSNVFLENKAVIPKENKDEIMYNLHILGIDSGSIFQGIPDKIQTIMQEEEWKNKYLEIIDISGIMDGSSQKQTCLKGLTSSHKKGMTLDEATRKRAEHKIINN